MSDERSVSSSLSSRRDFLKTSAVAGAAVGLAGLANVHAADSATIKIGLVGCGGRGTGAADNSLSSTEGVKIVALADAFQDRLDGARNHLTKAHANKVDLPKERCFVGLDAYKDLLKTDIDIVLLATPPAFRPIHIEAAVAAGKNIFCEKPVATDAPGIRRVLAAAEDAKKKGLASVAGTQRRHQTGYNEIIKRLHDGAIGNIVGGRCYWNQGGLWSRKREDYKSDLEWQIRNWLYFTWLSGDHICEQHVHNLDVINWVLKAHPVRAVGMGGRQVRTEPIYGNIFDHHAIDLEYPNGVHVLSMCRQIDGCENSVSEAVVGTKGMCDVSGYRITGEPNFSFNHKQDNAPYVQEHTDLIASIRKGEPLQELQTVAESTLTAIMSRMSTYTGKAITWDQALNSTEDLFPKELNWQMELPTPAVAVPGKTPFA
jgi:myo-inositol 2-dehydrogenase/D-chiro-inositol 1-dehydrogenase